MKGNRVLKAGQTTHNENPETPQTQKIGDEMKEKRKNILFLILTLTFVWACCLFNSTVYYAEPPPSKTWYIRHDFGFPFCFLSIFDVLGGNYPETYCTIDLPGLLLDLMFFLAVPWLIKKAVDSNNAFILLFGVTVASVIIYGKVDELGLSPTTSFFVSIMIPFFGILSIITIFIELDEIMRKEEKNER